MYNSSSHKAENFAYGFLTGGIIVGSLALLFAPKKGSKLRKDISKDIYKAKNDLINSAESYLSSAGDYLSSAKEKAEDFISDGTHKITQLLDSADAKIVDKADDLVSQGKNKINKLMETPDNKSKDKLRTKHT